MPSIDVILLEVVKVKIETEVLDVLGKWQSIDVLREVAIRLLEEWLDPVEFSPKVVSKFCDPGYSLWLLHGTFVHRDEGVALDRVTCTYGDCANPYGGRMIHYV